LSLQELQSEIERKADEEASRILEASKQEADRIIAEANAKAQSLRDERTKALERELDARERAELAVARMDHKGELLRIKSGWVKRVLEEAEKRIAEMAEKGGREYHELLGSLILEAVTKTNGNKFNVEVSVRDKEAIKHAFETIAAKAGKIKKEEVVLQLETLQTRTLGGVVVSTADRGQYFNNTLEARLSTAARTVEGAVYKILFEAGEANE